MYTFSKPKYEFYPYSQHDIPPSPEYQNHEEQSHYLRHYPTALVHNNPNYYHRQGPHTSVEIQPSQSYEIKQTDDGYKTVYHGSDGYSSHEDTGPNYVPVIMLRVPGPAKYAAHLQALLQRYIEARAAQFLQQIQEQDIHTSQQIGHDHTHDSYLGSYGGLPVLPYGSQQAYVPAPMYIQPVVPMHAYFTQQAVHNPYAHAHIAQTIDVGDDHSHSVEDTAHHGGNV